MSRLLNKPLEAFTWYALIILAFSIPAYYFAVDYIWLEELDEHNQIIKQRIENGLNTLHLEKTELVKTLTIWSSIEPGTKISPVTAQEIKADSVYTAIKPNPYAEDNEIDRFRGLSAYINVNGQPYHLTVETNVEESDETFLAIASITFLFFGLLVAGFIILNRRIGVKIWQPFKTTLDKLHTFDLNKKEVIQFEETDIKEFEELNAVLVALMERNISIYRQQKEFTENASHELQTPLAIIKSKLDLFLQDETLTLENYRIIEEINNALARVSNINKNLLMLSKIENLQFSVDMAIDMSELLLNSIALLSQFDNKQLVVETAIQSNIILTGNTGLMEVMTTNLLINAFRYSEPNSNIRITLTNGILSISNPGTSPLEKEGLFKRFASVSSETRSSGLGLAIVKEICTRYGWIIEYKFEANRHIFSVVF